MQTDHDIQESIRNQLTSAPLPNDVIMEEDGLGYKDGCIFMPEDPKLKRLILELHHDSLIAGHLG